MIELMPNEKIEDLQYESLKIIQNDTLYKFTTDAVLLANYVQNAKGKRVLELGAGSGVISLLLSKKQLPKKIVAVELQSVLARLAKRSVALNGLSDVIEVVNCDVKDYGNNELFDVVVSNPPYREEKSGIAPSNEVLSLCKTEKALTLHELLDCVKKQLKVKGYVYFCYPADRLAELFHQMENRQLTPSELTLVSSTKDSNPYLALVAGRKCVSCSLTVKPQLVLYDEKGDYTDKVKALYNIDN